MASPEKTSRITHGRVASPDEVQRRVMEANSFNHFCAEFRAAVGAENVTGALASIRERLSISERSEAPVVGPEVMLEVLRKLNGELITEKAWRPRPDLLVEIFVSGPADNQVLAKTGEKLIPPGASLEFNFKADWPEGVTIYARSDEGDIVRPNRDPKTLGKVSLDFSPFQPDSAYHFIVDGLPD